MQEMLDGSIARSKAAEFLKRIAIASTAILLSACAAQAPVATKMPEPRPAMESPSLPPVDPAQIQALNALISAQDKLYRVGAPLLVNNTELCKGNARNLLGFTAKNKYSYTAEFTDAARQVLN